MKRTNDLNDAFIPDLVYTFKSEQVWAIYLDRRLNEYSNDGWELVGVYQEPAPPGFNADHYRILFKKLVERE